MVGAGVSVSGDELFARKILDDISSGTIFDDHSLSERQFFWSKHFRLSEMPSRPFVLSQSKKPSKKMRALLSIKPTRSLSGVQVIAVMLPPFPCPANCTYCPSALDGRIAPKSYTGFEPSTLRAQRVNYDAYKIVSGRVAQLDVTGNKAEKIELIFQGSTFNAMPKKLREAVVKKSIDGVLGGVTESISQAKLLAENSARRIVGITFETRPDWCTNSDIAQMLSLGGTRVELGVQSPDDEVYLQTKRGHSVADVVSATQRLKDSSFKVLYHLMPGLPGSTFKKDLRGFKEIFSSENFRPDMVKFYPCLVIRGTELYEQWMRGEFTPMGEKEAAKLLAEVKSVVPKWVRIMRINRDIPSTVISGGVRKTNLRQLVEEEMKKHGYECNCIRCREAGLASRSKEISFEDTELLHEFYNASNSEEAFISVESEDALFGFVRLRKPAEPFLKEITPRTALIRELHVYGKALGLGMRSPNSPQHQGIGKELMLEAERVARERFGADKMVVISGLGVKEYYIKNFGYKKDGDFVSKKI